MVKSAATSLYTTTKAVIKKSKVANISACLFTNWMSSRPRDAEYRFLGGVLALGPVVAAVAATVAAVVVVTTKELDDP